MKNFDIKKETAAAVSGVIDELKPTIEEPKKRRGRPKAVEDGKTLSLWVDQKTHEDIKHYAKKYGLTVSALIRLFLAGGLESCHAKEKKEAAAADPIQIPQPNISTVGQNRYR